jgi:hypothetical protein
MTDTIRPYFNERAFLERLATKTKLEIEDEYAYWRDDVNKGYCRFDAATDATFLACIAAANN